MGKKKTIIRYRGRGKELDAEFTGKKLNFARGKVIAKFMKKKRR